MRLAALLAAALADEDRRRDEDRHVHNHVNPSEPRVERYVEREERANSHANRGDAGADHNGRARAALVAPTALVVGGLGHGVAVLGLPVCYWWRVGGWWRCTCRAVRLTEGLPTRSKVQCARREEQAISWAFGAARASDVLRPKAVLRKLREGVTRAGKTRRQARGYTRTLARTRTASLPCNIGRKKLASPVVHLNLQSLHARNQRATAKNGQQASQIRMS